MEQLIAFSGVCGALITVYSLVKLVVQPFTTAMKRNDVTNQALQKSVDMLAYDLKESQKDRDNIHKILDKHDDRLSRVEDDVIRNSEQIKTLFNR